ncbi:MAG: DUF4185 domain-containing protein [Deltaproteobacteria bacterium]|nr:DUF4185 domain-containing protein [Deltaproteobacteria bacterium]MBW2284599.1 DUF4185 domain-containing protein [Deltaproteobacteria bacterium]
MFTRHVASFLFLLLFAACSSAPRFHVAPVPSYDACFDREEGWTGADGAYTVALSGGRILWLFGDTWIGKVRDNRHVEATLVHNTVAIQPEPELVCPQLRFFYSRSPEGMPKAVIRPKNGNGWLWMLDGVRTPEGLVVFMLQVEQTDASSAFGFRTVGSWLGFVGNPEALPAQWRIRQTAIPHAKLSENGDLVFGAAVLKEDGFIYIYGTKEHMIRGRRGKSLVLARVPETDVRDFDRWLFFSGGSWVADVARAESLANGMANECSVSYLTPLEQYALVYTENGCSRNFLLRLAPRPWGPWGDPILLYQCPEMERDPNLFCYAAKAHPELSADEAELIVTYIASATDFQKLIDDAELYRPRFLKVRFEE